MQPGCELGLQTAEVNRALNITGITSDGLVDAPNRQCHCIAGAKRMISVMRLDQQRPASAEHDHDLSPAALDMALSNINDICHWPPFPHAEMAGDSGDPGDP